MSLDSFKDLLLKKTDDPHLYSLIKLARNDVLEGIVVESLEKMARKGDTANFPLLDFVHSFDEKEDPKLIHDALSHHASHYKTAIKALQNNPDNSTMKNHANNHMRKFFDIMNLASKVDNMTGDLSVDAVSPHPWERNKKTAIRGKDSKAVQKQNRKQGTHVSDTKGWGFVGKDFSWLNSHPHESKLKSISKEHHDKAYPLENVQINGEHLHMQEVPEENLGASHVFDSHPIMSHHKTLNSSRGESNEDYADRIKSQYEQYHNSSMNWHDENRDALEQAYNKMSNRVESNPAIGETPGDPAHAPLGPRPESEDISNQSASDQVNPQEGNVADKIAAIRRKHGL